MQRKKNEIKKVSSSKENGRIFTRLIAPLVSILVFGILGTFFICFPNLRIPNLESLISIWLFSLIIGVCGFWNRMTSSLLASAIMDLCITAIIFLVAVHNLQMSFYGLNIRIQEWIWITPMVVMLLFVWILPIINLPKAQRISDKLFAPRTFCGKIFILSFLFLVAIIFIGHIISEIYMPGKIPAYVSSTLSVGILSIVLAFTISQTISYQLWIKYQKELQTKTTNKSNYSYLGEHSMLKQIFASPSQRFYMNGAQQAQNGEFEKAIQNLSKAIEIDPENVDAYFMRGNAYSDCGYPEQAIVDFNFVIFHRPEDSLAFYNRSLAFLDLKQLDRAIADLDQVVRIEPKNPDGYNLRSVINTLKDEFDLAIKDATTVIELGKKIRGLTNRSLAYERKGDLTSAINDMTAILDLSPNDANYLCRRGLLYQSNGDKDKALEDLKKGLKKKNQVKQPLRDQALAAQKELWSN